MSWLSLMDHPAGLGYEKDRPEEAMAIDYKQSGVDVEAGDALVDWLQSKSPNKQPHAERIVSGIGGFASLFRAGFPEMKKPCLVTCTDGVGTKVKLASQLKRFEGIGQDLVAMCVNDLICCGGRPLLFLDYYATGKLNLDEAKIFLESVRKACWDSDCALVGGETAEMPGVYHDGDFDCAGFAVGIVDEEQTLGAHRVRVGQRFVGVASSGFHSNGYSLLRKVFEKDAAAWADQLMEPTALYVKMMAALTKENLVQAAAHITGGGLENLPRVLPKGTKGRVKAWSFSPAYLEVQKRTGLSTLEMVKTLNCGLGFVLVVNPADEKRVLQIVTESGHRGWSLGAVEAAASAEAEAEFLWDESGVGDQP